MTDHKAELSMNIENTYSKTSGINSWKRTLSLTREIKAFIQITDEFDLSKPSKGIQQNLITCWEPVMDKTGVITFCLPDSSNVELLYNGNLFEASKEVLQIEDKKVEAVWGNKIFRILLKSKDFMKKENTAIKLQVV